jgi:formylglycine-generating enzyme
MMSARVLVAAGVLGLGTLVFACALDLSGTFDASGDGGDGGGDATSDATSDGAGLAEGSTAADGGADVDDGTAPGDGGGDARQQDADCVAKHPPAMVRAGTVCIDVTEVTNDQYLAFLGAPDIPVPSPECSWNPSNVPEGGTLTAGDTRPVGVNWCDAQTYCIWAGKRLCGKLGGGSLPQNNDADDPAKGQWAAACSNAGAQAYPYGNTFEAGACGSPGLRPVAVRPDCQGPVPGLFDMSGNVWEWVDACSKTGPAAGPLDQCEYMGGSYPSGLDPNQTKCRDHFSGNRNDVPFGLTGFRCCSL